MSAGAILRECLKGVLFGLLLALAALSVLISDPASLVFRYAVY